MVNIYKKKNTRRTNTRRQVLPRLSPGKGYPLEGGNRLIVEYLIWMLKVQDSIPDSI